MSRPTIDQIIAGRKCWHPKMPETPQCASCPFREGNDKEFQVVVARLRASNRLRGVTTQAHVNFARQSLRDEVTQRGDFVCHNTAYTPDGTNRNPAEFRQCSGAAQWYREGKGLGEVI